MSAVSFYPLLPSDSTPKGKEYLAQLSSLAADVLEAAYRLSDKADSPVAQAMRGRLRQMNSYYTNKIEGQHTLPADIEKALAQQFDADVANARKQRLALAHMAAEESLEEALPRTTDGKAIFNQEVVRKIHFDLYSRLPEEDRLTEAGDKVVPGELRTVPVIAGQHLAPPPEAVPALLEKWGKAYAKAPRGEARLIAVACSHHRLLWIHPFRDGNGRAARLHSHLALHAMGLTGGLWSVMRGLARNQETYYARLNNADLPKRNDLDGRGPLSQEELVKFAAFFLEQCLDQVRFMSSLLDLPTFESRLKDMLRRLDAHPWHVSSGEMSVVKPDRAFLPLHYTATSGPMTRAAFVEQLGLGDRTGRRVVATLLSCGLLKSPSSRGELTFNVPLASLGTLFPRLWPEAEIPAL